MHRIIRWSVANAPTMNVAMISILVLGMFALLSLRREVFPNFALEIVTVTVDYPGASPREVEDGICLKIEEAIYAIDGIKKLRAIAKEGTGSVTAELQVEADVQKVINEIRSAVDSIPGFPEFAEQPTIRQLTLRTPVIRVAVFSNKPSNAQNNRELRELSEQLRDELLFLPSVSQIDLQAPEYQIDVEVRETDLRKYGLSLHEVADRIRQANSEVPAGNLRGRAAEYLLRGTNKQLTGEGIGQLPILTDRRGVVLRVHDLATVRDGFVESDYQSLVDGQPGLVMTVRKTNREDLLHIAAEVQDYVRQRTMPQGYHLLIWGNEGKIVLDRLRILRENSILGLCLVFIVLGLFLDLRLAFWVALGIPISILGGCAVMWQAGGTLNMLSMFAFIMGIGIVVDDAIVIGENVYRHRQMGKSSIQAAIEGTIEVVPSVCVSVLTTVIAFAPMLFVTGVMGKFVAIIPVAMIAMLLLSLLESSLMLPAHLAHEGRRSPGQIHQHWEMLWRQQITRWPRWLAWPLGFPLLLVLWIVSFPLLLMEGIASLFRNGQRICQAGLHAFIQYLYSPWISFSLANPRIVYASASAAMIFCCVGLVGGGVTPLVLFPKLDSEIIKAQVLFPQGTPAQIQRTARSESDPTQPFLSDASRATAHLAKTIQQIAEQIQERDGEPVLRVIHREVGLMATGGNMVAHNVLGGHAGQVTVQLTPTEARSVSSEQLIETWRQEAGELPGTTELIFASQDVGPAGNIFEMKVLGKEEETVQQAVEAIKAKLASYQGVRDVRSEPQPGKWEMRIKVKPRAEALGVQQEQLARTIRAAYFGEEVMRLQRGRHEVKLMVRYPADERQTLSKFEEIRVRTPDGEIPIRELADVTFVRGYTELERREQQRAMSVTADLEEQQGNARDIVNDLEMNFFPIVYQKYPGISILWEGQQERTRESMASLGFGFAVAVLAMYALLTLEFRSYLQPLIILGLIPFGMVGAIVGHWLMGLPVTFFSMFGLVGLAGIVVNDSIVLVDFINQRQKEGYPLEQALREAGRQRFRPVLLTTMTTVAGLLPMMLETSAQAQMLVPMAVSISFGLVFATVLVLILSPVMYQSMAKGFGIGPGRDDTAGV